MKELFEELMTTAKKTASQICRDDRDLLDTLPLQAEDGNSPGPGTGAGENLQALRKFAEQHSATNHLSEQRLTPGDSTESPAGREAQHVVAHNIDGAGSDTTGGGSPPPLVSYSRSSIRPKQPPARVPEPVDPPAESKAESKTDGGVAQSEPAPMDKNDVEELKQRMDKLEALLLETLEVFK